MNRAELHNTPGFHPASLLAAADYLRATIPRKVVAQEPTALIRNEGHMNGFLDAVEALIAAASPAKPDVPKKEYPIYSQPTTENQNRP
jgi:hypothetical protein